MLDALSPLLIVREKNASQTIKSLYEIGAIPRSALVQRLFLVSLDRTIRPGVSHTGQHIASFHLIVI